MNPLLSILIPTKNRSSYCIHAIEMILSYAYQNFELIIQDNSDDFTLKNYIEQRECDNRLVYRYTPPPFSSIDNFNAVLDLATGDYLCLIGDDDGINPDIFKVIEWAKENNIEAITPGLNSIYRWPDISDVLPEFKNCNGQLSITNISGSVKTFRTNHSIKKLLASGGQDYLYLPFPKLYHGIVKKDLLAQIKSKTGNYAGGLSPDIYWATALSLIIEKVVTIDYPFTIPGICILCTPMDERQKKYPKLTDAPHFRDRGHYKWSKEVPPFYAGSNIWADSFLAALRDFECFDLIKRFNMDYLISYLLRRYPRFKTEVMSHYYNYYHANNTFLRLIYTGRIIFLGTIYNLISLFQRAIKKIGKSLFGLNKRIIKHETYKNVRNIEEALQKLQLHLTKSHPNSEMLLKWIKNSLIKISGKI